MSCRQLVAFVAVTLVTVTQAQESCVFGDDDDGCYFPCQCKPALVGPGVDTPCNRTTGHCHSMTCLRDHYLRTLNGAYHAYHVCQPVERFFVYNDYVAAYLVHPTTMERLTDDLSKIIRTSDPSNLVTDCSAFLEASDIAGINDTLMWEFDLERLYRFEKYFRFYIGTVPMSLTGTVSFEFDIRKERKESLTTFHMDCSTTVDYVECIQSLPSFYTAQYVFFKAKITPFKCFVFDFPWFSNTLGHAVDIDCSRCLQTDAVPCGNGYWCETCAAGWKPPDCREPCNPGYYGVNCLETYDWQGRIDSVTQNSNSIILTFTCTTMVPDDLESNYVIYVERLSPHYLQQEVPYVRGKTTVTWGGSVDDDIQIRFNLVAVFPDYAVTGRLSDAYIVVPTLIDDKNSSENVAANYAIGAVAGVCALALICIVVLIFVVKRKNKCLMCVTVDDGEAKHDKAQSTEATTQATNPATRQQMELPVLPANCNTGTDLNTNRSDPPPIMRRDNGHENTHIYTSLHVQD